LIHRFSLFSCLFSGRIAEAHINNTRTTLLFRKRPPKFSFGTWTHSLLVVLCKGDSICTLLSAKFRDEFDHDYGAAHPRPQSRLWRTQFTTRLRGEALLVDHNAGDPSRDWTGLTERTVGNSAGMRKKVTAQIPQDLCTLARPDWITETKPENPKGSLPFRFDLS
jgi:hypothetical protein